ncbi:MAG TPA: 4-hydroxythreonine-4-phosphate dehydrogenase PdxA [Thermoanaerobaculia bacterium]|nr:4-hydroxythreonine-4-phosphate dehydrogenase PdxA [Thermoanaerobaculia bacterium]
MNHPPLLAFTQGDPAGVGPEILLKLFSAAPPEAAADPPAFLQLLVAERAALDALRPVLPEAPWEHLAFLDSEPERDVVAELAARGRIAVLDPVGETRPLMPGQPTAADAHGALAALDTGIALAARGVADALVTAPLSKEGIARHARPGFVGHTDYLAEACGLEQYGRDYLMAFLAPDLQVALLTVHEPLKQALDRVTRVSIDEALACLHRHAGGRIAVAGMNPHAGEGGLLGQEDDEIVAPAVETARAAGIDAHGPESADSLFARARKGEFDWVLALYHDQGLIPVKTAAFGLATNWTLGLPWLRTSVDHGTAFGIAGQGIADEGPMRAVVETTLGLLHGSLPRR